MFKKRKVKTQSLKRSREADKEESSSSESERCTESSTVLSREGNKDEEEITEEKRADDSGKEEFEKSVDVSNKREEKVSFQPDSMVDELHQQLKHREQLFSASSNQAVDSDGDKIYKGLISTKSKKEELVKPVSAHIKQNFITDYQRDVCKDFLKHGYCGFGDTCKFIHVRDEYTKINKPVSKPWESAAKRSRRF